MSKKNILLLLGDFNAKTETGYSIYPDNMGQYGKGKLNENGFALLELCKTHDLYLANTKFQHKMTYRTIWQAPMKKYIMSNGDQ